jgi:hypothetical protein
VVAEVAAVTIPAQVLQARVAAAVVDGFKFDLSTPFNSTVAHRSALRVETAEISIHLKPPRPIAGAAEEVERAD